MNSKRKSNQENGNSKRQRGDSTIDFILHAPSEVLTHIVTCCTFKSMANLASTCKLFNNIVNQESVRRARFTSIYPELPYDDMNQKNPWTLALCHKYESDPDFHTLNIICENYKSRRLIPVNALENSLYRMSDGGTKKFFCARITSIMLKAGKITIAFNVGGGMETKVRNVVTAIHCLTSVKNFKQVKADLRASGAELGKKGLVDMEFKHITLARIINHMMENYILPFRKE